MNISVVIALFFSAVASATGLMLFRHGGRGNTAITDFFNLSILAGCSIYLLAAIAVLYALSKVSMIQVYPFTVLTVVLIYFYSVVLLGDKVSANSVIGSILVLIGLFLVVRSPY
jgi:drug/metabolite transporter (DMT)-like permease